MSEVAGRLAVKQERIVWLNPGGSGMLMGGVQGRSGNVVVIGGGTGHQCSRCNGNEARVIVRCFVASSG
jgi:alanine dehydrogenase